MLEPGVPGVVGLSSLCCRQGFCVAHSPMPALTWNEHATDLSPSCLCRPGAADWPLLLPGHLRGGICTRHRCRRGRSCWQAQDADFQRRKEDWHLTLLLNWHPWGHPSYWWLDRASSLSQNHCSTPLGVPADIFLPGRDRSRPKTCLPSESILHCVHVKTMANTTNQMFTRCCFSSAFKSFIRVVLR